MVERIPGSELLSAFHDGEVTPQEQAEVLRALEQSESARGTLQDFSGLSTLLKRSAERRGNPGLRAAVLQQLANTGPRSPGRAKPTSRPVTWKRGVAVLSTVAALLVVGVWLTPRSERGDGTDMAVASRLPAVAASEEAALGADDDTRTPDDWLSQRMASLGEVPQPGDVLRYLDRQVDGIVWIPVTVVDVQKSAGEIRLLLARNGILPHGDAQLDELPAINGDHLAILVESDWQHVAAAMSDLDQAGFLLSANVEASPQTQAAIVAQSQSVVDARSLEPERALTPLADPLRTRVADAGTPSTANTERLSPPPAAGMVAPAEPASVTEIVHTQFTTPLPDEFVEKIKEQQIAARTPSAPATRSPSVPLGPAPTEPDSLARSVPSTERSDQPPSAASEAQRPFWAPYATRAPARLVLVLKKSGAE
jgi:hypothetical protein